MPKMDGATLINTMRDEGYEVPVAVVSACFIKSQVSNYKGPLKVFDKPFSDLTEKQIIHWVRLYLDEEYAREVDARLNIQNKP